MFDSNRSFFNDLSGLDEPVEPPGYCPENDGQALQDYYYPAAEVKLEMHYDIYLGPDHSRGGEGAEDGGKKKEREGKVLHCGNMVPPMYRR